jgi:aldehyde:ferredoxin oxidoreductase
MVISPAGENLVKMAYINSDYYRQAARGEVGILYILGYKHIKGLMIKGTNEIHVDDIEQMLAMQMTIYKQLKESHVGQGRMKYGTPYTLNIRNVAWMLPTKNFSTGVFKDAESFLGAEAVYNNLVAGRTCHGCMLTCS